LQIAVLVKVRPDTLPFLDDIDEESHNALSVKWASVLIKRTGH
jgi:hypothetical protein